MDIETRLHGRRSYRRRCDLHRAGGLTGGNDPMQSSCFRSDPDASSVRLPDHPPPPAMVGCEPGISAKNTSWAAVVQFLLIAIVAIIEPATAASVNFENCMSPNLVNSQHLQFIPFFVNATFKSSAAGHNLSVTVYGNVTGKTLNDPLPDGNDTDYWRNQTETEGKIPDFSLSNNKYTTLKTTFNVLDYTPYNADPSRFCDSIVQGICPLAPSFNSTG